MFTKIKFKNNKISIAEIKKQFMKLAIRVNYLMEFDFKLQEILYNR